MGISSSAQSKAVAVDKYIDTAYDKVVIVSDNIEEVLRVAGVADGLEKYLGVFSVEPTERADGSDLEVGDYYLDSNSNLMFFYLGEGVWQPISASDGDEGEGSASIEYVGEWAATSGDPTYTTYLAQEGDFKSAGEAAGWTLEASGQPDLAGVTEDLVSPAISDGESTEFSMNLTVPVGGAQQIEVYYSLSTEEEYDTFYAYVDGVEAFYASGLIGYTSSRMFDVAEGQRALTFKYEKDGSQSAGNDEVRISGLIVVSAAVSTYKAGNIVTLNEVTYICAEDYTVISPEEPDNTVWFPLGTSGSGGTDGASAYEIAVDNGFSGTEVEWLASLVGQDGTNGIDGTNGVDGAQGIQGIQGEQGPAGADGVDGIDGSGASTLGELTDVDSASATTDQVLVKLADGSYGFADAASGPGADGESAYDIAVANGFVGTELEWLDSLVGEQGPQGETGDSIDDESRLLIWQGI